MSHALAAVPPVNPVMTADARLSALSPDRIPERHRSSATAFDPSLPLLRRNGDAYMLGAALLHALVLLGVGHAFEQFTLAAGLAAGLLFAGGTLFALGRGSWPASVLWPLLLVVFVAAEIHLGMGKTELHFGVFVTLSVLLVYRHWLPIIVGTAGFAVHHLMFDRLQAWGFPVYCLTQASFIDILIHAGFVVAQAGVGVLMAIQMRRDALLMAELEALTAGLSRRGSGTVDFEALGLTLRTGASARLKGVLEQVRRAVFEVHRGVDTVGAASREIAGGNLDLSRRTEDTAAQLQTTASQLHAHTASLAESARETESMSELAERAVQAAQEGARASDALGQRMQAMVACAQRITDITGTIDTLAFQTNILALNAAVESARAGEAGRGFAVVAGEVRQLARRSAEAAREVKHLIETTTQEIQAGSSVAQATRSALQSIDAQAREVAASATRLSRSLAGQAQGIAQVNQTVGRLDQATQENAALVEQTAASAESLRSQALALERAMAGFHGASTTRA